MAKLPAAAPGAGAARGVAAASLTPLPATRCAGTRPCAQGEGAHAGGHEGCEAVWIRIPYHPNRNRASVRDPQSTTTGMAMTNWMMKANRGANSRL